jgi:two-component system, NarL family, sensor kinase
VRVRRPGTINVVRRSIPATVAAFAALGLAAVALVAVGAGLAIRSTTTSEALRNARQLTRSTALSAVVPDLSDGVLTGRRAAVARLDRAVRTRVLRSPVVRVKVWTLDGRIVYSDAAALIGRRFSLGEEEQSAAQAGRVDAEVSNASRPENVFERGLGKLLEVYLPVRTPSGHRLLYEEYLRYAAIAGSSRRQWVALLPPFGGGLLILALAQLPLAWWLARRLERREEEREGLLVRLVESSDRERRRLAHALHTGPVQAVAGLAWRLDAAARQAGPPLASTLAQGASEARDTLREMRSLLVTLHPPALRRVGLPAALSDSAAPLRIDGVDVVFDVAANLEPEAEALVYRVADEALRNAHQHGRPQRVEVRLRQGEGRVRLAVSDDGAGFAPAQLAERRSDGHRGLALLEDLAADAGGRLTIESAPGRGTRVELDAPGR